MAMTQAERSQKYKQQFTRPDIKILKDKYSDYKNFVLKKGYSGLNEYINAVLAYDIKNNVIPYKKDIAQIIKEDIKDEQ